MPHLLHMVFITVLSEKMFPAAAGTCLVEGY